jgi:hypothetical protein
MMDVAFWPSADAFLDLSRVRTISDGCARCTGVAICDEEGRPARSFFQAEQAHFFYEFEVLDEIGLPGGGLEFRDEMGRVFHGKSTFQYGIPAPGSVGRGLRLRYHQSIHLEVAPGTYVFGVGLSSTDEASYRSYREGLLGYREFDRMAREHCRVVDAGRFDVGFLRTGKLLHHGAANLPGECRLTVHESPLIPCEGVRTPTAGDSVPTIVHVTHWKSGSQWIHKILRDCVPERIAPPQLGNVQFLSWPVEVGKVYPTVYITKGQFDSVRMPDRTRHFVVVRDLRDTLVSGYFSMKISHPVIEAGLAQLRSILESTGFEEGMIYMMDEWLIESARIQVSWLESGERLIRYEDLLEHDTEILERVLIDQCGLPASRERLREAVEGNRFQTLTRGRPPGQEDVTAHERKGIAGDWRNHFTPTLKKAFKARYGGLLVAVGYEKDLSW